MFKARKVRKKSKLLKRIVIFIIVFFFFFSYVFIFKYSKSNKINKNILNKEINYIDFNVFKIISNKIEESINKPINLLNSKLKISKKSSLGDKKNNIVKVNYTPTTSKTKEINIQDKQKIYIYNTHSSEKYVDYSVREASLLLGNNLLNNNISSYVETKDVASYLKQNNLKYASSYIVSRKYMIEAKEKNNNLIYFFDIHRDALSKEQSTLIKQGVSYAKILFVIGGENENYTNNLNNAKKLNDIIEKKMPGISRGIIKKEGKGVNGLYNQDISSNTFLIEVGADKNTKDEVTRTINILSRAIIEYIKDII